MGTRRFILTALVGLLLAAFAGAPALAQERDPFVPLVSEDAGAEPAAGVAEENGAERPEAEPAAPTGSEGLPATGADVSPFLGAAYVLIVTGGAALFLAKINATGRP